jgi:hypothetical protein
MTIIDDIEERRAERSCPWTWCSFLDEKPLVSAPSTAL